MTMSYFKAEGLAPRKRLEKEAVNLAMQNRWEEAVQKNREILGAFPSDVDAYNRLGRALMELGRYGEARESYTRALEYDAHNSIARKNMARLATLGEGVARPASGRVAPQQLFLGEVGKVGVVHLMNLAPQEVLAALAPGDEVTLKGKGQVLSTETPQGVYLGDAEPAHGPRLAKLIQGGNRYIAAIAGLNRGAVKVVIKEVYQDPGQEGRPSFPPKESDGFRSYVREGLVRAGAREEPAEGEYESGGWEEEEETEETETLPQGFSYVGGAATEEEE